MTPSPRRVATAAAYWLAVCAISLAIAVAFVAFVVSRDEASLEPPSATTPATTTSAP